jgi:hypothetical protein
VNLTPACAQAHFFDLDSSFSKLENAIRSLADEAAF